MNYKKCMKNNTCKTCSDYMFCKDDVLSNKKNQRKRGQRKMKARVLKGYPDKITNIWYNKDEIVNFDEKRIEELEKKGIVEKIKKEKVDVIEEK